MSCRHARQVWDRTVATLKSLGVWHEADAAAVARYATLSALHERYADRCLAGHDIATVNAGGYATPTPAMTGLLKTAAALLAIEKSLGLVAAARREFPMPPSPEDELDRWMRENP